MKKDLLKTPKVMYDLFTMNLYAGNGRKTTKYVQYEKQGKIPRLVAPPIFPSTKMEADCFPVSENTENKPDLP